DIATAAFGAPVGDSRGGVGEDLRFRLADDGGVFLLGLGDKLRRGYLPVAATDEEGHHAVGVGVLKIVARLALAADPCGLEGAVGVDGAVAAGTVCRADV